MPSQEQSPWSVWSSACGTSSPPHPRAETGGGCWYPLLKTDQPFCFSSPRSPGASSPSPLALPAPWLSSGRWSPRQARGRTPSVRRASRGTSHRSCTPRACWCPWLSAGYWSEAVSMWGRWRFGGHLQPRTWQLMQLLWKGFLSAAKTCSTG